MIILSELHRRYFNDFHSLLLPYSFRPICSDTTEYLILLGSNRDVTRKGRVDDLRYRACRSVKSNRQEEGTGKRRVLSDLLHCTVICDVM
jgi:hypothetical protein